MSIPGSKFVIDNPYAGMTKNQKKRAKKKERDSRNKEKPEKKRDSRNKVNPEKKLFKCFMCYKKGPVGEGISSYGGVFCKDCYKDKNIDKRDKNMHQARLNYSDREHRAFGSIYVDNWPGKPGRTFRTCSCYTCAISGDPPPQSKSLTYKCEDCGSKGEISSGFFDRRSSTGGLSSSWDEEDHWFCKKCWCKVYWAEGKWYYKPDGSVWFKPKLL